MSKALEDFPVKLKLQSHPFKNPESAMGNLCKKEQRSREYGHNKDVEAASFQIGILEGNIILAVAQHLLTAFK